MAVSLVAVARGKYGVISNNWLVHLAGTGSDRHDGFRSLRAQGVVADVPD